MFQSKPKIRELTFCGSLLAIVGSTIGFTTAATAIPMAYYQRTTQDSTLPLTDGARSALLVQTVPAGRYVINYSVTAINPGINENVRCGVLVNGSEVSNHGVVVGSIPDPIGTDTISGVAVTNSSIPLTIELVCSHDGGADGLPYISAGAELAVF
ncbi:hypothetical protein [Nostoc sp.]|uniref:hypothetical protein n=1 Tax=Nostoc sp. TaxID=1180 RepID=UPI002FFD17F3